MTAPAPLLFDVWVQELNVGFYWPRNPWQESGCIRPALHPG